MKKNRFLKLLNVMFFILCSSVAISQIDLNCKSAYTDTAHGPYSASCQQFLQDFIPKPSDSILYVNLAIWVFNGSDGLGQWSATSLSDIQGKVDNFLNPTFASLQAPKFLVSGVANISHSKIQFVLKSKGIYNFTTAYQNLNVAIAHHFDLNAINVYYVGPNAGCDCTSPGNYIMFVGGSPAYGNNIYSKNGLEHELGHMLGLQHTLDRAEEVTYVNTGNSCCPTLYADDFHKESRLIDSIYTPGDEWATQFGNSIGCNFSNPFYDSISNTYKNSSNNFMGYSNCQSYLSPLQLAVMHYKLRTSMKHVLTNTSYNSDLSRNSALDYNVQNAFGGETWTVNRYFKGNIIVKSGNILNILCKVGMAKNTHIIVEKGAQLIIDTGGEVTNISGQLWGGVQVYGTSNASQMLNISTGFAVDQGVCKIIDGGKISQAERGVANWYESSNGAIDWNSLGGIIIGNGGVFENNRRDVEFLSYQNPSGSDRSNFTNCTFKTTTDFNSTTAPDDHVAMWGVKGVWFNGCNFDYQAGNKYNHGGHGIKSIDAIFSVDKNGNTPSTFTNLDKAVYVENMNPLKTAVINNSQFTNNIEDATYIKNMNGLIYNNNTVNLPYYYATTGLYLNNCKNYQVKNNAFHENTTVQNHASVGVYAFNSQQGSHQIYSNNFSDLEQGISVMGDNSGFTNIVDGLKMNCNDFTQSANFWDITMLNIVHDEYITPGTVHSKQGETQLAQQTATNIVRNRYAAASSCNNCENQWFIEDIAPTVAKKAVKHGSNAPASTNTHPTPQPQYSDLAVNDVPSIFSFNTSHCAQNPGALGGVNPASQKLAGINAYLAALQENNSAENSLHFDIQATVAEKLSYYAMDTTAAAADTIIHILANNQGQMENADVLLVYAYMHKGDYTNALTKANDLPATRSAWKSLLLKLIEIEQEPEKMYSLKNNAANVTFLQNYANNDSIDGQSAAQAMLSCAMQYLYSEPRLHPNQGSGSRAANTYTLGLNLNATNSELISIYPNPTSSGVFVEFKTKEDSKLHIVIKDLLGKIIYSNFTINQGKNYVPMQEFCKGVYFISVSNEQKQILYQSKIVKQE